MVIVSNVLSVSYSTSSFVNLMIRYPHVVQGFLPHFIAFRLFAFRMITSIHLYYEIYLWCEEVGDTVSYDMLTQKSDS